MVRNSLELVEKTGAECLVVFLGRAQDLDWLSEQQSDARGRIVGIVPVHPEGKAGLDRSHRDILAVPLPAGLTRISRVKYGLLTLLCAKEISSEGTVVCVLGPEGNAYFDTIFNFKLKRFIRQNLPVMPSDIGQRGFGQVIAKTIDLAIELGVHGREGRPVGALFVVGDARSVLGKSSEAVLDPFRGLPENDRSIFDEVVVENVREIAQLDGAFIIGKKGQVVASCRHLETSSPTVKDLRGLGSRHHAAAGITRESLAIAVAVSESDGQVRVFRGGGLVATFEPVIRRKMSFAAKSTDFGSD